MQPQNKMIVRAGALLAVALLAGGYFGAVSPAIDGLGETELLIETAGNIRASDEARISQLEQMDVEELRSQLQQLEQAVPAGLVQSDTIRSLDVLAAGTGVRFLTLQPGPPMGGDDGLASATVSFTVAGEQGAIRAFLEQLQSTQLATVDTLSYRPQGGQQTGYELAATAELRFDSSPTRHPDAHDTDESEEHADG